VSDVADVRKLCARALPLLAIALSLAVGAWFASMGDGHLLTEKRLKLASFYDVQGDSLLRGKLSVPCWAIGREAFVLQGRCYGYFGITPSLLRIPLNFAWPEYRGRWGPLSLVAASALFLALAYALTRSVRRHLFPGCPEGLAFEGASALFLLALGLGSTNIFLLSRPVIYHEASIWSVAFALASFVCSFEYWRSGRVRWLCAGAGAAALALNARPIAGAGALLACALAPLLHPPAGRRSAGGDPSSAPSRIARRLLGATLAALALGSYLGVLYAKFGAIEPMPIRYNYRAKRLAKIEGQILHFSNIGWNLGNYFGSAGIAPRFSAGQVPLAARASIRRAHPRARIDLIEPYMSIPVAMTALLGLAALGTAGCLRGSPTAKGLGILALCTLAGPVVMLLLAVVSYRYFHEYQLWFVIAGAAGVSLLLQRSDGRAMTRWLARGLLALLVAINVALNLDFALRYQINDTNVGARIPAVQDRVEAWRSRLGGP
jgi:hypothetical protein